MNFQKLLISLLFFFCFYFQTIQAQIPYNAPEAVLQNETGQYASITLPNNTTVNWSISGAGGAIEGATNQALVFFKVTTNAVTLTATLSNGTSQNIVIPVYPQGNPLVEGDVNMATGIRMYPIYQLLRGERFKINTQIPNGSPKPNLKLLDFQGRFIATGESIDFRAPIRGSYYVVVSSQTTGLLKVEGIRPYLPPSGGINQVSPLTQPNAQVGNIDLEFDRSTNHTGGESLVTLGNLVVSCTYDFALNKTLIKAFQNDVLQWTWQSGENEYLRTITADATQGIAGIGSCGGASKNEDSVLVVKLNSSGVRQVRATFATTDGIDYGYGISFFSDGSLMATGFTEGTFDGLSSTGELDAFAFRINQTNGTITHRLQFGSPKDDRVFASRTLSNGNVILFGDTEGRVDNVGNSLGSSDIFLTEINANCVIIASNHYGSSENDLAFDLVIEPTSGDIFITGMTIGNIAPQFENVGNPEKPQVYTARINKTSKAITWLKQLGPTEGQSGETIALSNFGVGTLFYTNGSFAGASNNSLGSQASDDMVVAFFDFDGNLKFLYQFDQTTQRIFARAITFQGNNVFVLRDHVYEPNKPIVTTGLARFALPAVVTALEDNFQKYGFNIFPNPFFKQIQIKNATGLETYYLSNSIGQIIWVGRNIEQQDFSNLANGLYFLNITYKIRQQTLKLIKKNE